VYGQPSMPTWGANLGATGANDFARQADEFGQAAGDYARWRTDPDGAERDAGNYGSEGWGFESLRARHVSAGKRASPRAEATFIPSTEAAASHSFSQLPSDLMEAAQRLPSLLQVIGARVDIGSLGECGVVMTRPLAHDRDRNAQPGGEILALLASAGGEATA
jgi:hypothetical protein